MKTTGQNTISSESAAVLSSVKDPRAVGSLQTTLIQVLNVTHALHTNIIFDIYFSVALA